MTYQNFTILFYKYLTNLEIDKVGVMLYLDEKMEALESQWSQLSPFT